MEYNFRTSGKRIKSLRKSKGWSQEELAEQLSYIDVSITRGRIGLIENGNQQKFDLPFLLGCCRLFDCDIGYLLGEYNEGTTRDNQFIAQETGLKNEAIKRIKREQGKLKLVQLSRIILSDTFWKILNIFATLENASDNYAVNNAKLNTWYRLRIKEGKDPEDDETYQRAIRALERDRFEYDMEKHRCLILFDEIVNEFLPAVNKSKKRSNA